MAVVSASDDASRESLPATVTFGSSAQGAAVLYLQFEPEWLDHETVDVAYLLLEPADGTQPSSDDVSLDVWRVKQAWRSESVSWLHQPDLAPPTTSAIGRSSPAVTLRADVTNIVKYFHRNKNSARGIAIKASGGTGVGVSYSTGASGTRAPRLEVYVH